jgi:hypothetical protein
MNINEKIDERIRAYTEILEVIRKNDDILDPDYDTRVPHPGDLLDVIKMLEVSKEFGVRVSEDSNNEWLTVLHPTRDYTYEYLHIGRFHGNRGIPCSDDGRQPNNEWLLKIGFSTGPYVFGNYFKNECPIETFDAFFEELRSYGPKYSDTSNASLYFSSDNARRVYEDFDEIFTRHRLDVVNEMKRQKKLHLEQELEKLNRDLSTEA